MRNLVWDGGPISAFVKCANCERLFDPELSACPSCHQAIDEEYAARSAQAFLVNTQACAVANGIKTFDRYAFFLLALAMIGHFLDSKSSTVTALLCVTSPVVLIARWFRNFGRFQSGDEDYRKAYRDMKQRLVFWLVLAALLILVIYFDAGR